MTESKNGCEHDFDVHEYTFDDEGQKTWSCQKCYKEFRLS